MGVRAGFAPSEMAPGPPCLLMDIVVIEGYKLYFAPEETLVKP